VDRITLIGWICVLAGSVEVSCQAGFNGGLDQHFVLQVFEMVNGSQVLVATNWSRDPAIRASGKTLYIHYTILTALSP
jgi:hypothetical protein